MSLVRHQSFAGANHNYARRGMAGDAPNFVGEEWRILDGEVIFDSEGVGRQDVYSIVERAHPFAIGTIDSQCRDADSSEEVVGKVCAIVAGYFDLCDIESR